MSAQILDGAAVAPSVRERVAEGVAELVAGGRPEPGLATVLVGSDPASQMYVRNKNQATEKAGMRSFHHELPATTPQAELDALIDRLNDDPDVHGILVQSPLPDGLDERAPSGSSTRTRTSTASIPGTSASSCSTAPGCAPARRGRDRAARPTRASSSSARTPSSSAARTSSASRSR